MDYIVDGNKLIIDGRVVYEAPSDIDDTMISKFNSQVIMILYDGFRLLPSDYHDIMNPILKDKELQKIINQNVLCFDRHGNIMWRIESTFDYPIDHTYLYQEGGSLWAYRRDAWEFRFDPENGKILEQRRGL